MPIGDESNAYAFNSEEEFNRASRAIRFAEKAMRGAPDGGFARMPKQGMDVFVLVYAPAGANVYNGYFTLYDGTNVRWEVFGSCKVIELNDAGLQYDPPTRYAGTVVAATAQGEAIVAVETRDLRGGSGSGGGNILPIPTNIRCDPTTEDIVFDYQSYRFSIVEGEIVVEALD